MTSKFLKASMVALALAGLLAAVGCTQPAGTDSSKKDASESAAPEEKAPAPGDTGFTEVPIGDPQDVEGMTVAAVYFGPADMEPMSGPSADEADIHLEADISAAKGNKTGFGVGEFVPNLTIDYTLTKEGSGEVIEGSMMPMNASDGAHYGNNVKMAGAGNYELMLKIASPEKQGYVLHTDAETGVEGRFWKKPLELKYTFAYVPPRKF